MKNRTISTSRMVFGISMATLLGTAAIVWIGYSAQAADDDLNPDLSLSAFMRKKLDASSQILEGLTVEDSELIEKGAKSLMKLSKAEKWQVLISPDYREYSDEFRTDVKRLEEAAAKGNFDNAALQWFDVMKGCIECHKHVRDEKARKNAPSK